jgi:hypothetical protein
LTTFIPWLLAATMTGITCELRAARATQRRATGSKASDF